MERVPERMSFSLSNSLLREPSAFRLTDERRAVLRAELDIGAITYEEFEDAAGCSPSIVCPCGSTGWHRCPLIYGPFPRRPWREAHHARCVSNPSRACRGGSLGSCRPCPFDPTTP
jgi:hypothetical protein